MNNESIKVGDFVCVDFNNDFNNNKTIFNAEVLYMPFSTGDCWHLRTKDDRIVYVQNFEIMYLYAKKDTEKSE